MMLMNLLNNDLKKKKSLKKNLIKSNVFYRKILKEKKYEFNN